MTPVLPDLIDGGHPITFAKDQPEYLPLPALRFADGLVLTRWRLSAEELAALVNGEDLYLSVWTFNRPLQPVLLTVGLPMEQR